MGDGVGGSIGREDDGGIDDVVGPVWTLIELIGRMRSWMGSFGAP